MDKLSKYALGAALSTVILLFLPTIATSAATDIPDLPQSVDSELQLRLERSLRQLNLVKAAREERLAVALVDITDKKRPRLAIVNGDLMMYSASLPKIAILLGAFQRIEDGVLKRGNQLINDLTNMIRTSSNDAATRVLNLVGPQYLLRLLQSDRYRLYDVAYNGGLWVGKPYGKSPAFHRDPLYSISHGATAWQVARFYYLLEHGGLVSPKASREMKKILGNPRINHKFVAGLLANYPEAAIYRKSGTWKTYHSDSAIVERDGRRYIAVALANDTHGDDWLRSLIMAMDEIIFTQTYAGRIAN